MSLILLWYLSHILTPILKNILSKDIYLFVSEDYYGQGFGAGAGSPWPTTPGSHVYIFFLSLIFKIIFVDYYKKRAFLYKSLEKKLFTYILVGKEPGAVKALKLRGSETLIMD